MTISNTVTGLILIVDDTPTNLDVISETLSDVGFDVAIATSGERAIQQVDRYLPDLILLDVMMPGMDGFETCKHLKSNPQTCDIPIIFMTSLSDTDRKVKALELGAVDYITKPFHEQEVLARVKTQLQLRRLTQDLAAQVAQKAAELQSSQLQLVQSEKMSALGLLVAGVAHEINNPVGFVRGNLSHAEVFIKDLLRLVNLYQQHYPQPNPVIQQEIDAIDLDYLREDLPKLIESMRTGIHRIADISTSLRTFSRADSDRPVLFDLHDGLDSTLLILKHRLKANACRPEIKVVKAFGALPLVQCYAGQLNQVFMNILVNAIDALEEATQKRDPAAFAANLAQITIHTESIAAQQQVVIRIKDNGVGMTEPVKHRVFENLFTTKSVGQGTGLGLAIAHSIVVEKHAGTLTVNSAIDQGAEFVITLPVNNPGATQTD